MDMMTYGDMMIYCGVDKRFRTEVGVECAAHPKIDFYPQKTTNSRDENRKL